MELHCTYNPLRTELLAEPLETKNGYMIPPQGPGLGVELNPEALRKYAFSGAEEITLRQKALSARKEGFDSCRTHPTQSGGNPDYSQSSGQAARKPEL